MRMFNVCHPCCSPVGTGTIAITEYNNGLGVAFLDACTFTVNKVWGIKSMTAAQLQAALPLYDWVFVGLVNSCSTKFGGIQYIFGGAGDPRQQVVKDWVLAGGKLCVCAEYGAPVWCMTPEDCNRFNAFLDFLGSGLSFDPITVGDSLQTGIPAAINTSLPMFSADKLISSSIYPAASAAVLGGTEIISAEQSCMSFANVGDGVVVASGDSNIWGADSGWSNNRCDFDEAFLLWDTN